MKKRELLRITTGVIALLIAAGCASTPKSEMYVLYGNRKTLEPMPEYSSVATNMVIGFDSITLPQYINQPVIVTRQNDYKLVFSEFQRWGEPLSANLRGVIGRNITLLLHDQKIVDYRFVDPETVDLVVNIAFTDLSGILGKEAVLAVRWTIARNGDRQVLTEVKDARYTRKLKDASYGSYVVAQSEMLAEFCKDLAASICEECAEAQPETDSKRIGKELEKK